MKANVHLKRKFKCTFRSKICTCPPSNILILLGSLLIKEFSLSCSLLISEASLLLNSTTVDFWLPNALWKEKKRETNLIKLKTQTC